MHPAVQVHPSILSADFRALERDVQSAQDAGADRIHCDIMDGHFVPNITFGPLVVEAVRKCVSIPLDVHLMISDPVTYAPRFCDAGADYVTVHAELRDTAAEAIRLIAEKGVGAGVTVNPDQPVELLLPYLDRVKQVLLMTVHAGFGGQKFIPDVLEKVERVYREARDRGVPVEIQVDGGINEHTALQCAQRGANLFVAGSYIFGSGDHAQQIELVREGARKGWSTSRVPIP